MAVEFTIAIPTHDRRETALMAVRSVLAQSRPAAHVIVLCDGCTDGTAEAVRALGEERVEALDLPKGPGYAYDHRNRALELARSEAIMWLADDDLLLPDHLERIGELWDSGRCDLVQSAAVMIDPDDALTWMGVDWSVPELRAAFERENTNPMASVSVRVDLARAVGGWNGALPRLGDWDLWRRALAAGACSAASPEPTHLHFRATGREQAWPLRVRQNERWLARLGDPEQLLALRVALRRARDVRDAAERGRFAALTEHAENVDAHARALEAHRDELARDAERVAARLAAVEQELSTTSAALAELRQEAERTSASEAAAAAEAIRLGATLARIEAGGWWRLRRRLLPLLRLAGRSS